MFETVMDASAPADAREAPADAQETPSDAQRGAARDTSFAAALAGCDPIAVENIDMPAIDALVTGMGEVRSSIARLQALEASMLAAVVDVVSARNTLTSDSGTRDLAWREVSAEIGAALNISDRTVQRRLGDATITVDSFPATHAAWLDGKIDRAQVRVITDSGMTLSSSEARAEYERRVLDKAERLAPGRLGPVCRAAAATVDPESITARHKKARATRGVRVIGLDDGMARLQLDAAATLVHAVFDRTIQMARTIRDAGAEADHSGEAFGASTADGSGEDASADADADAHAHARDERTLDQTRADILTDLLLTAAPTGHGHRDALARIDAHVQVTVPADALHPDGRDAADAGGTSGESRQRGGRDGRGTRGGRGARGVCAVPGRSTRHSVPAELAGHGPIDDNTARMLAGAASGWDRIFTDTSGANPLHVDRYRPSEHLRRLLRIRDEHCRFPGCRQPAQRCDLDHTIDAAKGGPTEDTNLAHLCRRHHVLKHHTRWRVRQLGDGTLEWTSPTGRLHLDDPAPRVRFTDDDPPPF